MTAAGSVDVTTNRSSGSGESAGGSNRPVPAGPVVAAAPPVTPVRSIVPSGWWMYSPPAPGSTSH